MKSEINEVITGRFIEQLKAGVVPWQRPWVGAMNLCSKKSYRGINALMLGSSKFSSPYWVSFKQALDLGGSVRKGEKGSMVVFYKLFAKTDSNGNPVCDANGRDKCFPLLRYSHVFNFEQTEGIGLPPAPEKAPARETVSLEEALRIVEGAKLCAIEHAGNAAFYSPKNDAITMPDKSAFHSAQSYYHTLFHEMTHATGHVSRLAREGVTSANARFGSEVYSKEELVAEIGASFVSNAVGILSESIFANSASYLDSWIAKFERDPKLIIGAASQAQRASDIILGLSSDPEAYAQYFDTTNK